MIPFGEIAANSILIRAYVPEPLQDAYDRIVETALRGTVLPEADALRDTRPLAQVIPLERKNA